MDNLTRELSDEQLQTAELVLKALIVEKRDEIEKEGPNHWEREELEAMYKVQSRILGILQDRHGSWGP